MIYPHNGYGKGHGHKGTMQGKGVSYNKGCQNSKGWQQRNSEAWENTENKTGDAKGWAGQDAKGKDSGKR